MDDVLRVWRGEKIADPTIRCYLIRWDVIRETFFSNRQRGGMRPLNAYVLTARAAKVLVELAPGEPP